MATNRGHRFCTVPELDWSSKYRPCTCWAPSWSPGPREGTACLRSLPAWPCSLPWPPITLAAFWSCRSCVLQACHLLDRSSGYKGVYIFENHFTVHLRFGPLLSTSATYHQKLELVCRVVLRGPWAARMCSASSPFLLSVPVYILVLTSHHMCF